MQPESKKKVGAPKKAPTFKPSLRCEVELWKELQAKCPGKLNRMFNEWLKSL